MTMTVQVLIPAGQSYKAKAVAIDRYNGETKETDLTPNPLSPGVMHTFHATSTRSIEIRELPTDPNA